MMLIERLEALRMEQQAKRRRRPPSERFAGPEHLYDLAETAKRLRAEPRPAIDGHRQMTIFRHGPTSVVLFDFEAGGRIVDHVADGLVAIQALAGRIEVKTPLASRVLDGGRLLVLAPWVRHDLHASLASQVLLTVHLQSRG